VIALRRPAADFLLRIVTITLAVLMAGCGTATTAPSQPVGSRAGSAPALTAVPGGRASSAVGASVTPPTTTMTEFGRIFDSLPPSFPRLPGQEPAATGAGPTSGSFAVNLSVADARKIIEVSLIDQGWTVVVGSPLEDGTVVLEAARAASGCKTEVRFTPMSGTVIMSVLYGATCPFG
jgi:hypothetical protein